MDLIVTYQWPIFISLEVASLLFLLLFSLVRYVFAREKTARVFLLLFVSFIFLEAVIAYIVYNQTGKIETFQVVIFIFIIYACTFGIADFKKLDRYIKKKIGNWRGVDLLTEKDKRKMTYSKDPKVITKKNLFWTLGHTLVFIIAQVIFWFNFGNDIHPFLHYVTDWSWFQGDLGADLPFTSEIITQITQIWIIIYVIDTVVAWSYIFFPGTNKEIS